MVHENIFSYNQSICASNYILVDMKYVNKTWSLDCRDKYVHRICDTLVSDSWVLSMFLEIYEQFGSIPNVQSQKWEGDCACLQQHVILSTPLFPQTTWFNFDVNVTYKLSHDIFGTKLFGLFGSNGMIWFLIICNGPLRKHIKSFGMPCTIMGGLYENGCSTTWNRPQTWPIKTFLRNLIWLEESKA